MHGDYVYPSIFLSYLLFFLFLIGGLFFFFRSLGKGYWGRNAEDVKYTVFNEDNEIPEDASKQGEQHA